MLFTKIIRIAIFIAARRSIGGRNRRLDDLQSFITLEEFMLAQQDEDQRQNTINRSLSPRVTPLISDHVHVQYRNLNDNDAMYNEQARLLGDASSRKDMSIYGRTTDEAANNNITYTHSRNANTHAHTPRQFSGDGFVTSRFENKGKDCANDKSYNKCVTVDAQKRLWNASGSTEKRQAHELTNTQQAKHGDSIHWRSVMTPDKQDSPSYNRYYEHDTYTQSSNYDSYKAHDYLANDYLSSREVDTIIEDFKTMPKRLVRNEGNFNEIW